MARRAATDPVAEAAAQLYAADSLRSFTEQRKKRADELRRGGDAEAAAEVARLPKPSASAWAVNRLWHQARADFDALFAAGEKLRRGDFAAQAEQRDALGRLRARAVQVLRSDGHGATPAMLHRIATTLQALSATGSFDPDPPGALAADRDPPGFEVFTDGAKLKNVKPAAAARPARAARPADKKKRADEASARETRALATERERIQRTLDRHRHTADIQRAIIGELREKLAAAESQLADIERRAAAAEKELGRLRLKSVD